MAGIFISYRREDTGGYAGWLNEWLSEHFGEDQVFMDIDSIEPGVDFVKVIQDSVGTSDVLIALIGREWLDAKDEQGHRRLDSQEDFVRLEISAALQRGIPIVPALVQGARMPRSSDLPEDLAPLSRRQAIEISDARWKYDVGRLVRALEQTLHKAPTPLPAVTDVPTPVRENTTIPANREQRRPTESKNADLALPPPTREIVLLRRILYALAAGLLVNALLWFPIRLIGDINRDKQHLFLTRMYDLSPITAWFRISWDAGVLTRGTGLWSTSNAENWTLWRPLDVTFAVANVVAATGLILLARRAERMSRPAEVSLCTGLLVWGLAVVGLGLPWRLQQVSGDFIWVLLSLLFLCGCLSIPAILLRRRSPSVVNEQEPKVLQ